MPCHCKMPFACVQDYFNSTINIYKMAVIIFSLIKPINCNCNQGHGSNAGQYKQATLPNPSTNWNPQNNTQQINNYNYEHLGYVKDNCGT